jgi:myo-inositol-1(or 4)-monophosphatase
MVTEAGGLVGNFTGEADFLYQREVVAGNPKVYGAAGADAGAVHAFVESAGTPAAGPAAPARKATRIRKADLPSGDDAPF